MDNESNNNSLENNGKIQISVIELEKTSPEPVKHTFEEAVNLLGTGKYHLMLLMSCGMCLVGFVSELLGISILLASAKCDLKLSFSEEALLASAAFLGVVLSAHATGFLADTYGRNKTLVYSIALATICSIISGFSTSAGMLIIFRFLVGFLMNGSQSCVFSYMGEFHSNYTKTKYITLLTMFFAFAGIYSPALAIAILPKDFHFYIGSMKFSSWRIMLLLNSLPTLIGCISLPFFPESPKFLLVKGKTDEALSVLRQVYKINTGKNENTYPVKFIISNEDSVKDLGNVKSIFQCINMVWNQSKPLFSKKRRLVTIVLSILQFSIYFISHGSFMWIPVMIKPLIEYSESNLTFCQSIRLYNLEIKQNHLFNKSFELECSASRKMDILVLQFMTVVAVSFGILYFIFALIINTIGKSRLLLIWMLICGPAITALIWTKGFILNIILLLFYMLFGNNAGLITSISVSYYPTNINGMAMCLVMMIGRIGAFIGSIIISYLLNHYCEYLFVLLTLMICVLISLWFTLPKEEKVPTVNKN